MGGFGDLRIEGRALVKQATFVMLTEDSHSAELLTAHAPKHAKEVTLAFYLLTDISLVCCNSTQLGVSASTKLIETLSNVTISARAQADDLLMLRIPQTGIELGQEGSEDGNAANNQGHQVLALKCGGGDLRDDWLFELLEHGATAWLQ